MVNLDGGSAGGSAGGNWLHNPGLSETNGFGASRSFGSHDGVDFSGPLGSAIKAVHGGTVTHVGRPLHGWPYSQLGDVITVASNDGWQEIYQEFGGMNNIKVGAGDVIKTGQRIATLGRLNGAGSGSHVHIGVSHGSLWDHGGSSTKGWYDVTKMHGKSDGAPKSIKKTASSGIQSLIKKQVGSGFFKFMSKLANKFGDNGGPMGSVGLAGDESQRAREIAKALKQAYPSATDAGIAGILGNWMQESRLSPSAIDSKDHGTGLGQWTFGRETGLRNWLRKHGYAWNSAKGQLEYALHEPGESGAFKSVLRMSSPAAAARKFFAGWESGGNEDQTAGIRTSNAEAAYKAIKGHAKGGRINKDELSVVNEKGWELFKPDTGGLMVPHEASEKIINGQNKKVSIDARTNLTIQGHADSSTINRIDERIEKRNNDLVEKMRQLLGSNDEGGLTV